MTLNLNRALKGLRAEQVVVPHLRAAMYRPTFPGFEIGVRGWRDGVRAFDGWFHPSTHASWTARQLTYYLRHGAEFPVEQPTWEFVMAVTQGSFFHRLFQTVLLQDGVIRQQPGTKATDDIELRCEPALVDHEHNRRGHADGEMATADDELLEIKTMNDLKIKRFTSEDVLREENPYGYWDQAQDYLDIADKAKMRYVLSSTSSPYLMQEFIVHADPAHQARQRAKYREALEAAQEGDTPDACCAIKSAKATSCPAREFCPIGRMS